MSVRTIRTIAFFPLRVATDQPSDDIDYLSNLPSLLSFFNYSIVVKFFKFKIF